MAFIILTQNPYPKVPAFLFYRQFQVERAVIALFDIRVYLRIQQALPQRFRDIDIVYTPALILQPDTRKTLSPPAITARLRMKMAKAVYPAFVFKDAQPTEIYALSPRDTLLL